MKPSVSKKTSKFLDSISSKVEEDIIKYIAGKDELERMIIEENLSIHNVYLDHELDLMIVVLNNTKLIKRKLSEFEELTNVNKDKLHNFTFDKIGIHWSKLDFDLSLKGFLQHEIALIDKPFSI